MKRILPLAVLLIAACSAAQDEEETARGEARIRGSFQGTVFRTGTDGLNIRSAPNTAAGIVGGLADGDVVTIACQTSGEVVEGNEVWDYVGNGYVSDAFVRTGYEGFAPNVTRCGKEASSPKTSSSTSVDIDGPPVRSHVQAFADLACGSVGECAISTYDGHHPSADLALDMRASTAYGVADNYAFGDRVAQFALDHQSSSRIWYVIYRQRINYGSGWEPMEDRGSITQNHYDHVHVSFYP